MIHGTPKGPERCLGSGPRRPAAAIRVSRLAAAGALAISAASACAQETAAPAPDPIVANELASLPPLEFSAVETLLTAFAFDEEAARLVDSFWQPAIVALVAANPDKAEVARSFGAQQRDAELAMYRPLVARTLDRDAVEVLYPEVRRQLDSLRERISAEYRDGQRPSEDRRRQFGAEAGRIRASAAARTNSDLLALARLAVTPDGIALRDINRRGLYMCIDKKSGRFAPQREPQPCAELAVSPALLRLQRAPMGERLIYFSASAYVTLAAMVAMSHAAGLSLHRLLPPDAVRAAGLAVPADRSLDKEMESNLGAR